MKKGIIENGFNINDSLVVYTKYTLVHYLISKKQHTI